MNPGLTRLEIGKLLFSEYSCPLESKYFEIWADQDYIVHVIGGEKTWHTTDGSWRIGPGDTLFFKKGGAIIEQHFGMDFCVFVFFLDDETIRGVLREGATASSAPPDSEKSVKCALPVQTDTSFEAFLDSIKRYFSGDERPAESLVLLKLKELILSLTSGGQNPEIADYFKQIAWGSGPSIEHTMERNFRYRLSMEEFARLCGCSLSKFKRDFSNHFGESPGKWLLKKRLEYSAALLRSQSELSITDVIFESGFEDSSHFSKSFKNQFGLSPSDYRTTQS